MSIQTIESALVSVDTRRKEHAHARSVLKLELSKQQRREMSGLVRPPTSTPREVRRERIVLLRAEEKTQEATAQEVGVNRPVVTVWERRLRRKGMVGLLDAKGRGRKSSISPQTAEHVLTEAVQPPAGRTRWSVRAMAGHMPVSPIQTRAASLFVKDLLVASKQIVRLFLQTLGNRAQRP